MTVEKTNIGDFIKELRLDKGLTQKELAKKLNVSVQSIYLVEIKNSCGNNMIRKLSDFFNIEIRELRKYHRENN